jgi:photosystem II stability/assembly factor-like uncharacterized protein
MSDRILVSTRKGLVTVERGSNGWAVGPLAFEGVPVTAALADRRDGSLYVALKHGHFGAKLHRSDDGGRTWPEVATPAFPEGTPDAPSLNQIFTIEAGGAQQPGRLWIGAVPAGLFRSDDRGASWQFMRPLWDVPGRSQWMGGGNEDTAMHTVSPDPRDPERVMVAISCAGVWETSDGGSNWLLEGDGLIATYMPPDQMMVRDAQDPHRVARCASNPDVLWMQHHCGIFRSADAGAHWLQLKPPHDDFGFAVAAHPRDPETAWFVPAIKDEIRMPRGGALCVTRTRDGGKSWDVLRDGLPQRDAYDLIYRHGLDVDDSGERLAMGSTTGALWVSDSSGESWQLVSAHLPPIYAVRFT